MKPSRDAARPSCLAMNPNNLEASAARRVKLLAAFLALPEDDQADLLEATETMAHRAGGVDPERDEALRIIRQMYQVAGWERQDKELPLCCATYTLGTRHDPRLAASPDCLALRREHDEGT